MIHICTPYREDKNLGRAYNEAFERCPDGDALCVHDIDVLLLTPDAPVIMQKYLDMHPDGVFVCRTNRISELSVEQHHMIITGSDIKEHIIIANMISRPPHIATPLQRRDFSGFLILMNKHVWQKCKAPEYLDKGGCIGVDTMWSRAMIEAGITRYRMDSIYCWHSYRLLNGIADKTHLQ